MAYWKGSLQWYQSQIPAILRVYQSNQPPKFYTRKQPDTMGDRHEHSPSRDNRDQETREFYRAMVIGQERMAEALQTLTTVVERMNTQDR